MSKITVAATQMACSWNLEDNIEQAVELIREAATQGAQVVLLQELFETPYFCIEHNLDYYDLATTVNESQTIQRLAGLARELSVVIPVSWYERAGNAYFNSMAMIDATGELMGVYRKTHIPEYEGYHEKFYFNHGDTGFRVWDTTYGRIGVGICWDQWFPEAARCMALQGAEILLYPTAIGSEPNGEVQDSMPHWQNVMCGHAGANMVGVVASNRIGSERAKSNDNAITFYGSAFIADHRGEKVQQAGRDGRQVLLHTFDLEEMRRYRRAWGCFRDRRPEAYRGIGTLDGYLASGL
ncbi:MAG: N-carbamoylputrescine amidase [Oceanospirillaceae bacterium]|nr:N-carbamoylputrescine amidase [Oceanospirillaceae bacterium]